MNVEIGEKCVLMIENSLFHSPRYVNTILMSVCGLSEISPSLVCVETGQVSVGKMRTPPSELGGDLFCRFQRATTHLILHTWSYPFFGLFS